MNSLIPALGDAVAFLSSLSGNAYAVMGFFSTLLTFVPFSMTNRFGGRFGRWLSSKPENKRLALFIFGAALLLWASFQVFSDERAKLKLAQDQLAAVQEMLSGKQSRFAYTMN